MTTRPGCARDVRTRRADASWFMSVRWRASGFVLSAYPSDKAPADIS
ncbi:hypothetical protein ACSCBZ_15450 [Streptomyces niveiscabiei]|nr:hypothetical protein [Streptomyces sp. V2]